MMNSRFILLVLCFAQFFQVKAQNELTVIEIPESSITLYTSSGHESTALRLAGLLNIANEYVVNKITGFKAAIDFKVYSPEDWPVHTFANLIYGMAHFRDKNTVVVAAEDNPFWKAFVINEERIPDSLKTAYMQTYTSEDGAVTTRAFFDLLSIHELAHLYQFNSAFKQQRFWLTEFYCNLLLHTVIAEAAPEHLAALELLPILQASTPKGNFEYTTLQQFDKDYRKIGTSAPVNYGWYQFRFHDAARKVYDAAGKDVIVKLWQFHQNNEKIIDEETLIKKLHEEVHPELANMIANW